MKPRFIFLFFGLSIPDLFLATGNQQRLSRESRLVDGRSEKPVLQLEVGFGVTIANISN